MKKISIFQSVHEKGLRSFLLLINKNVRDSDKDLITCISQLFESIQQGKYTFARGSSVNIDNIISRHHNSINFLINRDIKRVFEENHQFSVSFEAIQEKKDSTFKWFDEVTELTKQLREKLDTKNPVVIMTALTALNDKVAYNNPVGDFADTLSCLTTEFIVFLEHKPKDELSYLFDKMNFHPLVKKTSEKLFKDGYYPQAIFEASKALFKYVKKVSGLKALGDKELISQAFYVQYSLNPLIVTKRPLLCLNSLSDISEIDEQVGFFHLFTGTLVGVRNPKAHDNIIQKDPHKTLEYLSLISLLARRVDEAKLSPERQTKI